MYFYLETLVVGFIIFICIAYLIYNLNDTKKNIPDLKYIDKKFDELINVSDVISNKINPNDDISKVLDIINLTIENLKKHDVNSINFDNKKYDIIVSVLEAMDITVDNNIIKIIINKIEDEMEIIKAKG